MRDPETGTRKCRYPALFPERDPSRSLPNVFLSLRRNPSHGSSCSYFQSKGNHRFPKWQIFPSSHRLVINTIYYYYLFLLFFKIKMMVYDCLLICGIKFWRKIWNLTCKYWSTGYQHILKSLSNWYCWGIKKNLTKVHKEILKCFLNNFWKFGCQQLKFRCS